MKKGVCLCILLISLISACKKNDSVSPIVYQDNFSVADFDWPVDSTTGASREFTGGQYSIQLSQTGVLEYALAPYFTLNFPYSLQVDGTIKLDSTSQQGSMGVIFNFVDRKNFDILEVYNLGYYMIWQQSNGLDSVLVKPTYSNAINTGIGIKNSIKIIQNSSTLQLLLNNASAGTFALPLVKTYSQVGIFAGTSVPPYYTPVDGLFSNFIITKL